MSEIEKVYDLKSLAFLKEKEPEIVSEENFIRAKANMNAMQLLNTEDMFLYFASLNLLNTYVKQNKNKMKYYFKQFVTKAFDSAIVNQIKDVTYSYDDVEKLLIVNISGMQFSFHNVNPSAKMEFVKMSRDKEVRAYFKKEEWEGFRLQPIAETLFKYANNLDGLTKESLFGDLKSFQNECVKAEIQQEVELEK